MVLMWIVTCILSVKLTLPAADDRYIFRAKTVPVAKTSDFHYFQYGRHVLLRVFLQVENRIIRVNNGWERW